MLQEIGCFIFRWEIVINFERSKNNSKISIFRELFTNVLDYAPTQYEFKIKEGMYINWEKPNLNKQLNHVATIL